jgi:hypothetical protein
LRPVPIAWASWPDWSPNTWPTIFWPPRRPAGGRPGHRRRGGTRSGGGAASLLARQVLGVVLHAADQRRMTARGLHRRLLVDTQLLGELVGRDWPRMSSTALLLTVVVLRRLSVAVPPGLAPAWNGARPFSSMTPIHPPGGCRRGRARSGAW